MDYIEDSRFIGADLVIERSVPFSERRICGEPLGQNRTPIGSLQRVNHLGICGHGAAVH